MKISKSFKKIIVSLIVIGAVSIAVTQSSFYRRISQSQRLFNQIYNQIFSTYLHELNPEEFTKATINSITANLAPYTSYMVEEEQHQMNILSKGKYGGVGIQLSYRNEQMIVIAPMDGGPAQTAGILSGDIILKVGGQPVSKAVEVQEQVELSTIGETLAVEVMRESKPVTLKVSPGSFPTK